MDIEKSKERCKELTKEAHAGWIGLSNIKAIGNVLEELEKKDKIIDLMATEFALKTLMYSDMSKEEIKEYFTNKAENVGE